MTQLAPLTTLGLGGPTPDLRTATSQVDVVAAIREAGPDARVLGGGSNVVVADAGVDHPVVLIRTSGWHEVGDQLHVQAGTPWDEFVAAAVAEGWSGIEALSGIPGSVGATPIQNVGAYGQDVSHTIAGVRVLNRNTGEVTTLPAEALEFGYRDSALKRAPMAKVVLTVAFALRRTRESTPIRYAELARKLGVEVGDAAATKDVREAVLELRRGKGMVLDPADPDTRSVGSFFTNPFVDAAPEGAPAFRQPDGRVKTSAAWLIEHAGVGKGFALPGSRAAVSGKHTLALTNRGGATTAEVLELAAFIRARVEQSYGIRLEPEPVLWGCGLP